MTWVALVVIVVALGVVLWRFYRHAQAVETEVSDSAGHVPPPMFAGTQRKIRRSSQNQQGMS